MDHFLNGFKDAHYPLKILIKQVGLQDSQDGYMSYSYALKLTDSCLV